jgi:hypothetical protein
VLFDARLTSAGSRDCRCTSCTMALTAGFSSDVCNSPSAQPKTYNARPISPLSYKFHPWLSLTGLSWLSSNDPGLSFHTRPILAILPLERLGELGRGCVALGSLQQSIFILQYWISRGSFSDMCFSHCLTCVAQEQNPSRCIQKTSILEIRTHRTQISFY